MINLFFDLYADQTFAGTVFGHYSFHQVFQLVAVQSKLR